MTGMMSSDRNRGILGVDDRWNDDGFWLYRGPRGNRKGGKATGGRGWRRALRKIEKRKWKKETEDE